MATVLAIRIAALQTEVRQQRDLIQGQKEQIGKQQAVLDIQFRRIADIQAELDLVKATVRAAVPAFAAALSGAQSGRTPVAPDSSSRPLFPSSLSA
jgi:hypothetical protein